MRHLGWKSRRLGGESGGRSAELASVLEFSSLSDRGQAQPSNHGYLGYVKPTSPVLRTTHGWLFAIADGFHSAAPRAAVQDLLCGFQAARPKERLGSLLPQLVQEANQYLYEIEKRARARNFPTGTALVACALREGHAVVAHVGDSRCYLIRDQHAQLITQDHIFAKNRAIGTYYSRERNDGSEDEREGHFLGTDLLVKVHVNERRVLPGDVLMLCCDRLYRLIEPSQLPAILATRRDLNAAARELVALARTKDVSKDLSVQLVRVRRSEI